MNRSNQGRTQKQTNIAITGLIAAAIVAIVALATLPSSRSRRLRLRRNSSGGSACAPTGDARMALSGNAPASVLSRTRRDIMGELRAQPQRFGHYVYAHSTLYDKPVEQGFRHAPAECRVGLHRRGEPCANPGHGARIERPRSCLREGHAFGTVSCGRLHATRHSFTNWRRPTDGA